MKNKMRKISPGEIILVEYLYNAMDPDFLYEDEIKELHNAMDPDFLYGDEIKELLTNIIINKKKIAKADAKLLAKLLGTTEKFWLNLQKQYDKK